MNDYDLYYVFETLAVLMFAILLMSLADGCAQEHGRIEGPPLYVHLCDAMSKDDCYTWGSAAADLNEVDPILWVGHGRSTECNSVNVCPGLHNTIRVDGCVIYLSYEAGAALAVAEGGLLAALEAVR